VIIATHAGTGKTTLAKMYPDNFIDFVSIPYKYYLPEPCPPDSSVLMFLELDQVPYFLCYPHRNVKPVYQKRYIERGNSNNFLDIFIGRWDAFMYALESNNCAAKHIVLDPQQYLSDVVEILKTS